MKETTAKKTTLLAKQHETLTRCQTRSRSLLFALVLILAVSVGHGFAATAPEGGSSGSLHIWEDSPEYPQFEIQPDSGQANANKKGNAKNKANAQKDNTKVARVSWDAWSLPIGNGRLGAVV